MNKILLRLVAVILVPCLLADPVTAAVFTPSLPSKVVQTMNSSLFAQEALAARARLSGKRVISSLIPHGLRTLFQRTQPPNNPKFLPWIMTGLASNASLWYGVHSGSALVPSVIRLGVFITAGILLIPYFAAISWGLIRSPSRRPLLRNGIIGAGVLGFALACGSLGYGYHLIQTNYLAQISLTQAPQRTLDIESERLMNRFQLFDNFFPADAAEKEDNLRQYLERFSLDTRHRIIQALQRTRSAPAIRNDPWGWGTVELELQNYDNPANLFALIDFLETGVAFPYQDRYMQSPIRLPGRFVVGPTDARQIWKWVSGGDYDIAQIIIDAFTKGGIFSKSIGGNGSQVYWNVSELVMNIGKADLPLDFKMRYAAHLGGQSVFRVMSVRSMESAWAQMGSLRRAYSGVEQLPVFDRAAEIYEWNSFPYLTELVISHYGGWDEVLRPNSPAYAAALASMKQLTPFVGRFEILEGQEPIFPNFMKRWDFDQVIAFYENFQQLVGKLDDRKDNLDFVWGEIFTYADQAGIPITVTTPLEIKDADMRERFVQNFISTGLGLQQSAYRIKNVADFKKLQSLWLTLLRIEKQYPNNGLPSLFERSIHRVDYSGLDDRNDLLPIIQQTKGMEPSFAKLLLDQGLGNDLYLKRIHPSWRIRNIANFRALLTDVALLKALYGYNAQVFPAYRALEDQLISRSSEWERYITLFTQQDTSLFSTLISAIQTRDQQLANRWMTLFLESNYGQLATFEGLEDLTAVEQVRKNLNQVNPSFGDGFLITIAKHVLDNTPVDVEKVDRLLSLARTWKFNSPAIGPDIKELYGLVAYFIGNHVVDYLDKNPTARTDERLAIVKSIGITKYDTAPVDPLIRLKKTTIYAVQGDWRYLTLKATGRFGQQLNDRVSLYDAPRFKLENGFTAKSVENTRGSEIANLFIADPGQGARVALGFDVGYLSGGVSAEKFAASNKNDVLVMDMPLGFTTGNGKPTDIAILKGDVQNWFMSMDRAHGLVIVYADGTTRIVDKLHLRTQDLFHDSKATQIPDRPLDLHKMEDYFLFLDIAKTEKLSIAANLLLINNDERVLINDGKDARRLLLEFSDRRIGILNMTQGASTAEATQVASALRLENGAMVTKAVYEDTGYYDYFSVHTREGTIVLGHSDKASSSNRVFIYRRLQSVFMPLALLGGGALMDLLPGHPWRSQIISMGMDSLSFWLWGSLFGLGAVLAKRLTHSNRPQMRPFLGAA